MAEISLIKKLRSRFIGGILAVRAVLVMLLVSLFLLATKGKEYFQVKKREHVPKIITDPKWGSHHYANLPNQNITLHYVEKGDRNKPLLLCLHGFPECWFSFRDTLVEFSKDFWVVAVDMRGYGDSDKPTKAEDYKLDVLVDDTRELIEVLGKEKCHLVAHDWGGVIAWAAVHRYPHLFMKHVSLNGPHPTAFLEQIFNSYVQSMKSWYTTFFMLWYLPEMAIKMGDSVILSKAFQDDIELGRKLSDEEVEVYRYYFSLDGAVTGPLNYYRHAFTYDLISKDMRCTIKSFIIWGSLDKALEMEIVSRTFKYCDDLSAVFIPDAGHFVLQEFPDKVHAQMRKFLEN